MEKVLWIWSGRVLDSERRVLRIFGGTTWRARGERIRVISYFVSGDLEGIYFIHGEVGLLDPGSEIGRVKNALHRSC